jgi:hypothetical protein
MRLRSVVMAVMLLGVVGSLAAGDAWVLWEHSFAVNGGVTRELERWQRFIGEWATSSEVPLSTRQNHTGSVVCSLGTDVVFTPHKLMKSFGPHHSVAQFPVNRCHTSGSELKTEICVASRASYRS